MLYEVKRRAFTPDIRLSFLLSSSLITAITPTNKIIISVTTEDRARRERDLRNLTIHLNIKRKIIREGYEKRGYSEIYIIFINLSLLRSGGMNKI